MQFAITGSLGTVQVAATPFLIWFGLSDELQEGNWRWSSTESDTTYYEWDTNAQQPDNGPNEHYGCLAVPAMKWHDCMDNVPYSPFICEYGIKWAQAYGILTTVCPMRFVTNFMIFSWWRHQMEIFSTLLASCTGIHRSPVNSPVNGQWRGALMFSLICTWTNGWVNETPVIWDTITLIITSPEWYFVMAI